MKSSSVCPKCDGRKFYVIEEPRCDVAMRDSVDGYARLGLACHEAPTGKKGILGDKKATLLAPLEAWVCAQCSYTELYSRLTEVLAHLAKHRSDVVRVVDATAASEGPFR
jgi:predicted nucleic-acid-binding Zn-ribbon protein